MSDVFVQIADHIGHAVEIAESNSRDDELELLCINCGEPIAVIDLDGAIWTPEF